MYVRRTISLRGLVEFGWLPCALVAGLTSAVAHFHTSHPDAAWLALPSLPISSLGAATAILLGFRNNSAYQRWWEARKLWGRVLNCSRAWGARVASFLPGAEREADRARLTRRHLAFCHALRLQLRQQGEGWEEVTKYLAEGDEAWYEPAKNKVSQILYAQGQDLGGLREAGHLDNIEHANLGDLVKELYDLQGACERIAGTPLPRQYAFFTTVFVWIYVGLLPFVFVGPLGWAAVPLATLVGWMFISAEQVGRYTEDPFTGFKHDVAMSSLCRKAEIDLLQMLGEPELPAPLEPVDGVLM